MPTLPWSTTDLIQSGTSMWGISFFFSPPNPILWIFHLGSSSLILVSPAAMQILISPNFSHQGWEPCIYVQTGKRPRGLAVLPL